MSLTLSKQDIGRFESTLRTLLSPLESDDRDAWRDRVVSCACELLGAQRGVLELVGRGVSGSFDRDYGAEAKRQYTEYYRGVDVGRARRDRERLSVWSRSRLFPGDRAPLLRSECYNDYLRPNHVHDSMGMTVWGPTGDRASLYLHTDRFGTAAFGKRGLALLRMLQPAFEAGAVLHRRLAAESDRLTSTLDGLGQAIAVFDAQGRLLHRTPALAALLEQDPQHRRIAHEAATMARVGTGLHRDPAQHALSAAAHGAVARIVRTALGTYRLRCVSWQGTGDAILVSVTRRSGQAIGDAGDLRQRFGLTRREAQVALLLADRRTNREIADSLCISTHTARHHTQWILRKLGIHSRREVPGVLSPRERSDA